jgi:predicted ATPase
MIKHIKASNILSFGPDGLDLELKPLNVLIGANGSGKSNFLDLIDLMRSTPSDLQGLIRTSGGTHEWIWKLNDLKVCEPASSSLYLI